MPRLSSLLVGLTCFKCQWWSQTRHSCSSSLEHGLFHQFIGSKTKKKSADPKARWIYWYGDEMGGHVYGDQIELMITHWHQIQLFRVESRGTDPTSNDDAISDKTWYHHNFFFFLNMITKLNYHQNINCHLKTHTNMITKLLANKKISSKTHNQSKIKILFKFKFIILNKFKRGEESSCINFSHKKKTH
jgi:hypothetical protein